jgi:hypothetical protein
MSLTPSGPRGAYVPAAPNYDGRSSDWAVDTDGRRTSIDPIDSGMQMGMFVQRGELTSSPSTGNDILTRVTDLGGPRQHEQVVAAVNLANPIAGYIQNGSVTILNIVDQLVPTGGIDVTIYYRNNITARNERASTPGA